MTNENADQEISITFPSKYWTIILASVDQTHQLAMQTLEQLRNEGKTEKDLSEAEVTTLVGPLIIRGAIVDELYKAGIMTKEGVEKAGLESFMQKLKKYE